MFARRAYEPRMAGVDFAMVDSNWGAQWGASGFDEWCRARTFVDLITACSPSPGLVRPPWHGRGQGFESPKLHL